MAPACLIVANWKMNPSRAKAELLAARVAHALVEDTREGRRDRELVICPPFPLLDRIGAMVRASGIALGAQDCHAERGGAYTGDVSAPLLRDMGCTHVIVGHSERRAKHRESNARVRAKAKAVLDAGLVAIICVGENIRERDTWERRAQDMVTTQLQNALPRMGAAAESVVVAYEPVWAIGTGQTPEPSDISEMHAHIRAVLKRLDVGDSEAVRILYGGSVNRSNAGSILRLQNVDGVLVGGASLSADAFIEIANQAP